MAVHPDPVPDPMGEIGVVGTVPRIIDDLARCRVDGLTRKSGTRRRKRCRLGAMLDFEDLLHLVGRFTETKGAADVRPIALDATTAVDEDDRAVANRLRLDGPVRERAGRVDEDHRSAGVSEAPVRVRDEVAHVVVGHILFDRLVHRFVGLQRDGGRDAHQLELMGVFSSTASGCHGSSAGQGERR